MYNCFYSFFKDSDAEASSDSTSPSNKKRKPGRPRKCIPNKTHGVTGWCQVISNNCLT